MKQGKIFWGALFALCLVLGTSVGTAHAYFTTYVTAKGGHTLHLGTQTEIIESVTAMEKEVSLKNTGDSASFVRVKFLNGSQFPLDFRASDGWQQGETDENGFIFWNYTKVLMPGEMTTSLFAKIHLPEKLSQTFEVVVIQESCAATADENGNWVADWNRRFDTNTGIGTIG